MIARILELRAQWKAVRQKIEYVEKFGLLPENPPPPPAGEPADASRAELKLALARLSVNLSKTEKKLREQPEHRKAAHWAEDVARLQAEKRALQQRITLLPQ